MHACKPARRSLLLIRNSEVYPTGCKWCKGARLYKVDQRGKQTAVRVKRGINTS